MIGRSLSLAVGAVVTTALGLALFVVVALSWRLSLADHLALLAVGVAVAAFVLAVIGSVTAIFAYWEAVQRPVLEPQIWFPDCEINQPRFKTRRVQLGQDYLVRALGMHDADDALQSIVAIRNTSKTSARNPAMKVAFVGLAGVPEQPSGWQTASKDQDGVLDVQWEGGADYSVHGMWTRELPPLSLAGAYAFSRDPAAPITLLVELVADSFHERWTFPIVLSEETEAGDR